MAEKKLVIMRKPRIFTIPNILSFFRIILIGVFVVVFLETEKNGFSWLPIVVLVFSGFTDLLDGFIARHYNQISDLGKMLDPAADKLTQIAVCACLTVRYPQLIWMLAIYILKELILVSGGLFQLKRGKIVPAAKWYGKLSTCELYIAMGILLLIPNMPSLYVNIIMVLTLALAFFALSMYAHLFYKLLYKKGNTNDLQQM